MSAPTVTRGGWVATGTSAGRRATVGAAPGAKSARTRQRLLDAARAVFAEHGYLDATVELVVAQARVSRGTFYTYFESKTDVFRHLAASIDQLVGERVVAFDRTAGRDPMSNLALSTENYLQLVREHADLYRLVDQVAVFDDEVRLGRLRSRQGHVRRVASTIRRWQRNGEADPTVDPDAMAAALVSMLSSSAHWLFVAGDQRDEGSAARALTAAWARAVGLRGASDPASVGSALLSAE
ncbi:MAG: hypothetical protein RL219_1829 [Actinomycetota bacterium]